MTRIESKQGVVIFICMYLMNKSFIVECECVCERACGGERMSQEHISLRDAAKKDLLWVGLKLHKLSIYFTFPLVLIQLHIHTNTYSAAAPGAKK